MATKFDMFVLYGFVALCSIVGISANCVGFETLENFNVSKYMGTWYEHGRLDSYAKKYCNITFNWSTEPSGKMQIKISFIMAPQNRRLIGSAEVRVPYASTPGQLEVISDDDPTFTMCIFGTDYISYSVVYERSYLGDLIPKIMTREQHPPQSVIDEGLRIISEYGYSRERYVKSSEDCWTPDVPFNEKKTEAAETKEPESPPSIIESEEEKEKDLDVQIQITL